MATRFDRLPSTLAFLALCVLGGLIVSFGIIKQIERRPGEGIRTCVNLPIGGE